MFQTVGEEGVTVQMIGQNSSKTMAISLNLSYDARQVPGQSALIIFHFFFPVT